MQKSEQRILTTHVGSLPRSSDLTELLIKREREPAAHIEGFERSVESAVASVVDQQLKAGIDVVNNGEQPRVGFSTYVAMRMEGFGGESARPPNLDVQRFPDYGELLRERRRSASMIDVTPQLVGKVRYADLSEAEAE